MKKEYIIFDLDGTLIDSGLGITNSVIYALDKFGIKVEERSSLYKFIGPPLLDSFREYFEYDDEQAEKAIVYYREYYEKKGIFENTVYAGIYELLEYCKMQEKKVYLATSKPEKYAIQILEKYKMMKYFDYVAGSSMDEKKSGKSGIVKDALSHIEGQRSSVLMIGDRKYDVKGAITNQIDVAGVLYGYGTLEELKTAGADYIISTVDGLKTLLEGC